MTGLDAPMSGAGPLVRVERVSKLFPLAGSLLRRARHFVHAVDGVSFDLLPGASLGLVGESGCGKTTIGKLLVKLLEPTEGRILFRHAGSGALESGALGGASTPAAGAGSAGWRPGGTDDIWDLARLRGREVKSFRRRAQMIFQDPYESMNPRRTIYDTIGEPLSVQRLGSTPEKLDRVGRLLELVGLAPASTYLFRYPHELSGGQRQRVAIARALVIDPSFVVADEPTSMLDVSTRTGIMNLMLSLAQTLQITYLYVTHDLAVARYMCDRIAVMYLGKIVEVAETEELLRRPMHPYTRALLSAAPVPDPAHRREPVEIHGDVTRPVDPPPRCRFYDRCPLATDECRTSEHPPLLDRGSGHLVACYRV